MGDGVLRDLPGRTLLTCGRPDLPSLTYVEAAHLVQVLLPQHGCGRLPGAQLKPQGVRQHLQHSGLAAASRTCKHSLVGNLLEQGMLGLATCLPGSLQGLQSIAPQGGEPLWSGTAAGCHAGGPQHGGLLACSRTAAWWGPDTPPLRPPDLAARRQEVPRSARHGSRPSSVSSCSTVCSSMVGPLT